VAGGLKIVKSSSLLALLSSWPGGKNAGSGPRDGAGRGVDNPE
jgi:hypothetical protein